MVRLIHDGQLRLEKIEHYNEEELRTMLEHCGASIAPASTKVVFSMHVNLCARVFSSKRERVREEKHVAHYNACIF